ncbi:unnamed protein product [Cuscuta campestris]|uniref:Uncharacterized protein n=1 Tax=Cuscuta campestris TaxID=132261 RepID=A0A484L888_9ASTE|nr:unnamed protein product [Cuscuta campestris]
MPSDSQNISGQSYGSGSHPSSSSHSESSSPPVTPLIRRPSQQSISQAREIIAQEPVPLNQLPGRFNPKVLSWEQWEERLGSLGFLALDVRPVFKESFRVTKKVLAEVRTILQPGYKVLSKTTWPNIIEPHQGTRLGFHVASLEGDMNFNRMTTIIEDDDDDVQVLHSNRSPLSKPPSPPYFPEMDGATSARCSPIHEQSQKLNSPPATHLFESDRVLSPKKDVKAKGKGTGHSSSQKRKGSHKTSRGERRKKACFPVISEEVGRSIVEPKDQLSELTLLLDSAKSEINDRVEREKKLEEDLMAERARLEEERAKLVEAKRKLAELEDALAQAEEAARSKEQSFPDDAARWAAGHHVETARSILVGPEETMAFFKTMYKEPEGKKMITDIGSYGFQCG